MQTNNYSVRDIKTLEGIEAIRTRPGMYIGSVEQDGVHHITLEILSNAIDEYLAGYCTEINVGIGKMDMIVVTDNGRGVPFGKAEDGTETLENVFTKLHTGAKFNSDGSSGYNSSGGMNGIGSKATNALSECFNVSSVRDGQHAMISFEKGIKKSFKVQSWKAHEHGTSIQFRPDKEIFKNGIELNKERLKKQLEELSYLCEGLKITLDYKDDPQIVYHSMNGIVDYVNSIIKDKTKVTSVFNTKVTEERYSVSIALAYSTDYSESTRIYTNNIPNSAGTHLTGFRAAMTRAVNECARDNKILKEKDDNLTGEDLKEGLTLVLSLYMPEPVFSGQTKDVLTSSEGRTIVERLVSKEIRTWFDQNPKELKAIVDKALLSKKARLAAKKAREVIRETSKSVIKSKLPGKLTDCISNDPDETELFLVEGESAASSAKPARNKHTQAIMSLRGKVLNTQDMDLSKVLANEEIKSIVSCLGAGVGKDFNYNKLRYHKVIIMSDADVSNTAYERLFA